MTQYHKVLCIAGSEPMGSCGVQTDIKAISACGAYAAGALTCIVDENTTQVKSIFPLPEELVTGQIHSFLEDVGADAIKIGMLYSTSLIKAVAATLKQYQIRNLVVDPVMVTSGGSLLIEPDAIEAYKEYLFPMATIITPNLREAMVLLPGVPEQEIEHHIATLAKSGNSVVIKSLNAGEGMLKDLFYNVKDGKVTTFAKKKIETKNVNGTGCSFASAIAAFLARGRELPEAMKEAEEYINQAIVSGAGHKFGNGFGPVNHFCNR